MVGSQSTSSKNLPPFTPKKQKFFEEKQRKIDKINHMIEAVEARRIGLAKQIALAELEQDRLRLEARRIAIMESEEGSSNSDLLNMTEKASAKVAAFLEESRKAVAVMEAEKCKLLNDANNCAIETDNSVDITTILGPASVFGGLIIATVGLRMSLQNREIKQNMERVADIQLSENGNIKEQDTKEISDSQTYLNRDDGIIKFDDTEFQQITPEANITTDIDGLLDDLQQSFDEAIREANEPKSKYPPRETTVPGQGLSFSWETQDESIKDETKSVANDKARKGSQQDIIYNDAKVSPVLSFEQAKIDQIDIPSVEMQKNIRKKTSVNGISERTRPLRNMKIIGVGDSGAYSIHRILNESVPPNVEIWALDCDVLSLQKSMEKGAKVLDLGRSITQGRGTDGYPEVGGFAAEASAEQIGLLVDDSDVCIVTAGLGSGTGSGAAPVLCRISKESGAMTIAVVTKPFPFEGRKNMRNADDAIDRLKEIADAVIVISNRNVLKIIPDDLSLEASFQVIDEIVNQVVLSIVDMLTERGVSSADFADVSSVLKGGGIALVGMGFGSGERAAKDAAIAAMTSPLLDSPLDDARGMLVNIVGGKSLSLQKIDEALRIIQSNADQNANIVMSVHLNNEFPADSVSITLLATSFKTNIITRNIRDYIAESPA
jgi:cell division protein FtsZ